MLVVLVETRLGDLTDLGYPQGLAIALALGVLAAIVGRIYDRWTSSG